MNESQKQFDAQVASSDASIRELVAKNEEHVAIEVGQVEIKYKDQLEQLTERLMSAQHDVEIFRAKNDEIQSRLTDAASKQAALEVTERTCGELRVSLEQAYGRIAQAAVETTNAQHDATKYQREGDQVKLQLAECRAKMDQAIAAGETLSQEREDCHDQIEQLKESFSESQHKLKEAMRRQIDLEQEKEAQKRAAEEELAHEHSDNALTKAALEESKEALERLTHTHEELVQDHVATIANLNQAKAAQAAAGNLLERWKQGELVRCFNDGPFRDNLCLI